MPELPDITIYIEALEKRREECFWSGMGAPSRRRVGRLRTRRDASCGFPLQQKFGCKRLSDCRGE
jgi:hypothetical protein